jgi:hypothetical protein
VKYVKEFDTKSHVPTFEFGVHFGHLTEVRIVSLVDNTVVDELGYNEPWFFISFYKKSKSAGCAEFIRLLFNGGNRYASVIFVQNINGDRFILQDYPYTTLRLPLTLGDKELLLKLVNEFLERKR